jgi:hypothetical protein
MQVGNEKVYIHEFINIIGQNRANYMHHMTANWSPIGQRERDQLCYGVWGTVGSTGRWPEVVNMWEHDGFPGLAASFRTEFGHPGLQDPALAEWWARAASFRSGGVDRILVPAPWNRTSAQLCADGVRGETYAHEVFRAPTGTAWDVVNLVGERARPVLGRFGWELAGAWVTAMTGEREVLAVWAIPSWDAWAEYESAQRTDVAVAAWNELLRERSVEWDRFLMVDAPLSPFRTGRQPAESDRDSYRLP